MDEKLFVERSPTSDLGFGLGVGQATLEPPLPTRRVDLSRSLLGVFADDEVTSCYAVAAIWVGLLARLARVNDVPLRLATPSVIHIEPDWSLPLLVAEMGRVFNEPDNDDTAAAGIVSPGAESRKGVAGFVSPTLGASTGESSRPALAECAFALECNVGPNDLGLRVLYDPHKCEAEFAELMLDRLQHFALTWAEHPALPFGDIDPVSVSEAEMREGFLSPASPPVPERTVLDLIRGQAEQNGGNPAVVYGGSTLTYEDLWKRGEVLAQELISRGVTPGSYVPLIAPRSPAQIVGILGIQLVGAAYVPIDPAYPEERIRLVLEEVGSAVVVSYQDVDFASTVADVVVELTDVGTLAVDRKVAERSSGFHDPPALPVVRMSDPAYLIFTSGSTGRPKGVVVTHENLAVSNDSRFHFYDEPPSRFLMLSSFAFDSSVAGIFWTLTGGGALVLPGDGQEKDIGRISGLIQATRATDVLMLPSLYAALLDTTVHGALDSLRRVIVAGEECPTRLPERHNEVLPGRLLYNEYGPTETTVWCTACELNPGVHARVPIGLPVPHYRGYVLNEALEPVPLGVAGELYVGGDAVTSGYLNRPEITKERFLPEGSGGFDSVMYRTGDRVRLMPSGTLEFLGRTDGQVKIRGYRIELGEIEAVLRRDESVTEAVVVVHDRGNDDSARSEDFQTLVAYVTSRDAHERDGHNDVPSRLKDLLTSTLPSYMVPSHFVMVDSLPVLPNGKIDLASLPDPLSLLSTSQTHVGPPAKEATLLEELVLKIWVDALPVEDMDVETDFFEVGGHSILAAVTVARIRQTLDVDAEIFTLFDNPTVSSFCAALRDDPETSTQLAETLERLEAMAKEAGDSSERAGVQQDRNT